MSFINKEKLKFIAKRIYHKEYFNCVKKKIHGKNNKIKYNRSSILKKVVFDVVGSNNIIEIGDNCYLKNVKFYIRGDNHKVLIGNNVRFNEGGVLWFEDNEGVLKIGNETSFENIHIAVTESRSSVFIGEDCMFAYDIDIRTGDSHSIINLETKKRINFAKDINIGNHVWVAAHCLILKGCTISNNNVIATGSILTKTIEKRGVILAGNPAKIVRENITWSRERIK